MAETLKSAFQNPRTEQSESGELKNVRIVADEKDSSLSRVYFGAGENDYLKVHGDEKDTLALASVIGKLAESERTVAKFADVPPEERPVLSVKDCGGKFSGCYYRNLNSIIIDPKDVSGYGGAATLAHELQHFEQSRQTEWVGVKTNTADQIFVERIGESAADTAAYQYLYDVRNRFEKGRPFKTLCSGYTAYAAAKEAGKPESECVLAGMKGYAENAGIAASYAEHYHPRLFHTDFKDADYFNEIDPAALSRVDLGPVLQKFTSSMPLPGDNVDEVHYFRNLTTGMMTEPPADEKITRELRAPEFDYMPQNAYDRLKSLEPAVENFVKRLEPVAETTLKHLKLDFLPNKRFLQDVNVKVDEWDKQGIFPRAEYDQYKQEKAAEAARAAEEQRRKEAEKEQLNLMYNDARHVRPDWAEIDGGLHNLPCDVNREAAVKQAAEEQKTADGIDPLCLAADNDGAALRHLYQTENKAYHNRIHQLHTQFKQDEAAYETDLKNKRKDSFDKAAAADALEQKQATAKMIQGAVDNLVAAYPESMRKDVRAALQKGVETDKKAEMPAPKTFKDKIKLMFNRKKIEQGRNVVENCFKQVKDKTVCEAAVNPAAFDKKVDAARHAAEQADKVAWDAEKGKGALKANLNAECRKLRDTMFKSFESKAGQMLYARQRQDKESQKTNDAKAPLSLQGRLSGLTAKPNLMQTLKDRTAQNKTAAHPQTNQRMHNGESR